MNCLWCDALICLSLTYIIRKCHLFFLVWCDNQKAFFCMRFLWEIWQNSSTIIRHWTWRLTFCNKPSQFNINMEHIFWNILYLWTKPLLKINLYENFVSDFNVVIKLNSSKHKKNTHIHTNIWTIPVFLKFQI